MYVSLLSQTESKPATKNYSDLQNSLLFVCFEIISLKLCSSYRLLVTLLSDWITLTNTRRLLAKPLGRWEQRAYSKSSVIHHSPYYLWPMNSRSGHNNIRIVLLIYILLYRLIPSILHKLNYNQNLVLVGLLLAYMFGLTHQSVIPSVYKGR